MNDPQNEVTLVVYGLETLGQLVTPWTIDMTGMKNDEYTITTSKPLLKGPEYKRWKEDFVKQTVSSAWRESWWNAAYHDQLHVNLHSNGSF